jgi:hypothetical protein
MQGASVLLTISNGEKGYGKLLPEEEGVKLHALPVRYKGKPTLDIKESSP